MKKFLKLALLFICVFTLPQNAKADIIDTFKVISGDADFRDGGDLFSIGISGLEIVTRRSATSLLPGSGETLDIELISMSLIGVGTSGPYNGASLSMGRLVLPAPGPAPKIGIEGIGGDKFNASSFYDIIVELTFGGPGGPGGIIPFEAELISGNLKLEKVSVSAVPEPGTLFLICSGLIGMVGMSRSENE